MSDIGTVSWQGQTYELRASWYRNDDNDLVFPLADGTDLVCKGAYPIAMKFEGLEYGTQEAGIELTVNYSRQTYWPAATE